MACKVTVDCHRSFPAPELPSEFPRRAWRLSRVTARGFGPYNASAAVHAEVVAVPNLSFFDCTSRTGSGWMPDYYHAAD